LKTVILGKFKQNRTILLVDVVTRLKGVNRLVIVADRLLGQGFKKEGLKIDVLLLNEHFFR